MEDRKTELVKLWQYRKDHTFLLSHDDRDIKAFIKRIGIKYIFFLLIAYAAISIILGLVFGMVAGSIFSWIKGWFIFFIVFQIFSSVHRFFLYLNYVDCNGIESLVVILAISCLCSYTTKNIALGVAAFLVGFVISIKISKSIYYEKQNPINQFLKENGIEE